MPRWARIIAHLSKILESIRLKCHKLPRNSAPGYYLSQIESLVITSQASILIGSNDNEGGTASSLLVMAAWGREPTVHQHSNGRNRVRRETGKEQMVRVHYDEGVAIHIGPESCAGGREAVREALTGECAGQPLSREKVDIPGADAVRYAEGHTKGRAIASSPTTRRGRRPWHVQTLFVWEPGGLVVDQGGKPRLVRIGKARSRSR